MSKILLMIFAAVLLTGSLHIGRAEARGGGPAETMPTISFTDLPPYRPKLSCQSRRGCGYFSHYRHVRGYR
jgi:hypothetical protein